MLENCEHDYKDDEAFADGTVVMEFDGQEEMRQVCTLCGHVRYISK